MHGDAAFGEHAFEGAAHGGIVRRQDPRSAENRWKRSSSGAAQRGVSSLRRRNCIASSQFDAARAGADHGDRRRAGVVADAVEQRQPAFVEAADRLHRHRVLGGAGTWPSRGVEPMLIDSAS
jgi:hypothetical protein